MDRELPYYHSTSRFDQRLMKEERKEEDKEVKEGAIVSNLIWLSQAL